jgi:hypothetical protein
MIHKEEEEKEKGQKGQLSATSKRQAKRQFQHRCAGYGK